MLGTLAAFIALALATTTAYVVFPISYRFARMQYGTTRAIKFALGDAIGIVNVGLILAYALA